MHYAALRQPVDPTAFITGLKQRLTDALTRLDQALVDGTGGGVKVTSRRGPLFWSHTNPYGRFRLDRDSRIDLTAASVASRLDVAEGNESVL